MVIGVLVSSSELTVDLGARLCSGMPLVTYRSWLSLSFFAKRSSNVTVTGPSDVPVLVGSPMEKRRVEGRGWPVLRLIENLRFTKAPTCAMALDMMGNCFVGC